MLLAHKDCQDGSISIGFFHTIEQCDAYLGSTEEEREGDPYQHGSIDPITITINEDGTIEPFSLNMDM